MPDGKPDQPDLKSSKDFDMIGLVWVGYGSPESHLKMLQQVHAGYASAGLVTPKVVDEWVRSQILDPCASALGH